MPSLTALRAFEAVGRHLSFKKATEELCVTPSAVSRQIRLLEEHLGQRLLIRNNRKTVLTEQGEEYLLVLNRAFTDIAGATDTLFPARVQGGKKVQRLRLGVGAAFAEYWLTSRIGGFRDRHPDLELEIHITQTASGRETPSLDLDLEIYTGSSSFPGLKTERLFQLIDYPVCSPRLLRSWVSPLALDQLRTFTFLHEGSRHWWPRWFEHVSGPNLEAVASGPIIYDETLAIKMAVAGEGLALGDDISCAQYLRSGELLRPVKEVMVTDDWVSLLYQSSATKRAEVQLFRQWLLAEMGRFRQEVERGFLPG
jgi:LysR family glycine cleavage system transcriptional activator